MSADPEHFSATKHSSLVTNHFSARRAVIDIGTNSVKLLVADVAADAVEPVWEGSEQTRLGHGFYDDHRLQSEAIADTAKAVASFSQKAREHGAIDLRIIATSAARDAVNAAELLGAVRQACAQECEIISGEQEADWAFQGVLTDTSLREQPVLILDVGGGSTEFILGEDGRALFRDSFKLGTVRLLEATRLDDPPTVAELAALRAQLRSFLEREVRPKLAPHLATLSQCWSAEHRSAGAGDRNHAERCSALQLVGTGGTTSILARLQLQLPDYDRQLIEASRFTAAQVRAQLERLWALPLAARREVPGLPPNRADVILFGVAIFEAVMEAFAITNLRVSTRGLRFAAVRP